MFILTNVLALFKVNNVKFFETEKVYYKKYLNLTSSRSNLCERLSEGHGAKSLHDIVHEDPVPTIFGAFSTLFKNSDTSRKLKPMRKATTSELVLISNSLICLTSVINCNLYFFNAMLFYVFIVQHRANKFHYEEKTLMFFTFLQFKEGF